LEEVVNKASTFLIIDNPILLEIIITIKTRQANQLLAMPLANYNPHVISFGCKNRRINISYRRTFHINRREFIFFKLMAEEPLKILKIHNVPFIGSGFEFSISLPRPLHGYREKGKPQEYGHICYTS
jgi:hypothetical protein